LEALRRSENSLLGASDVDDEEIAKIMAMTETDLEPAHHQSEQEELIQSEQGSKLTDKSSRRMSWLRGEIESLKNFPSVPDKFKKSFKRLKSIRRKKEKPEVTHQPDVDYAELEPEVRAQISEDLNARHRGRYTNSQSSHLDNESLSMTHNESGEFGIIRHNLCHLFDFN